MSVSNWSIPDSLVLRDAVTAVVAFFLIWFVNMAITGYVARRQGRDDGMWAVLAFLTGPIALVILLVAPRGSLRRTPGDPAPVTPQSAPEWQPRAEGWVPLAYPPPPITIGQRLLGSVLGGVIGGGTAGILSLTAADASTALAPVVWTMAGGAVGYVVSGELIGAEGRRLIWIGLIAGALAIAVAELLARLMLSMPDFSTGAIGIIDVMLVVVSSLLFPVVYAMFAQGLLAAVLVAAMVWTTVMHRLLPGRADSSAPAPASG